MNFKADIFAGFLTITSTFIMSDFLVELVVGVVVYFASRILYKHYGERVSAKFQAFKNWFKK